MKFLGDRQRTDASRIGKIIRMIGSRDMGKINVEWHKANRMPPKATLDERVEWHAGHLKACACRTDLPPAIAVEFKKRGIRVSKAVKRG
jgi:hypothetical protein